MDPQQNPQNPNVVPLPQSNSEQIAPQPGVIAPNLQAEVVSASQVENSSIQPETAPVPNPVSTPVGTDTTPQASIAPTPPPAQVMHTGSVQGRALQTQDLANLSAGDDDLIEKEWVDTVENVIEAD